MKPVQKLHRNVQNMKPVQKLHRNVQNMKPVQKLHRFHILYISRDDIL